MSFRSKFLHQSYKAFNSVWFALTSRVPIGTHVFDCDWDVLVILDTCRPDALREIAPEFLFLSPEAIENRWSIASNSRGWIAGTFTEEYRDEVENTVYVNANGYASEILERNRRYPSEDGLIDIANWKTLSGDDFLLHHPVRDYAPDFRLEEYVPPKLVLDRAISAYQIHNPDRLIVHFHQPHAPYTYHAVQECRDYLDWERDPFTALQNGDVSFEQVWSRYLDELRYVLRSVEILCAHLPEQKTVISADHGEAFGEYGFYRHMLGIPHPYMKQVPWTEVSQPEERSDYEIEYHINEADQYSNDLTEKEYKQRLRNLGYME